MNRCFLGLVILSVLIVVAGSPVVAYERYNSGCQDCHGAFDDSTSTKGSFFPSGGKHAMHVSSTYMNTECDLCHTQGDNRNPFTGSSDGTNDNPGLGCTGCHTAPGLRAHHVINEVSCATEACHTSDPTPAAESVNPVYYGTVDTRVTDACNAAGARNTAENWTLVDLIGIDNDGDGLYDQNDPDCQPSTETPGEARQLLVLSHDPVNELLNLSYDNTTCAATSNNLYFGLLSQVSTPTYSGQQCLIGNTGSYGFGYGGQNGSLFFVLVANDTVTEGSYGLASGLERAAAGLCPQPQELTDRCDAAP